MPRASPGQRVLLCVVLRMDLVLLLWTMYGKMCAKGIFNKGQLALYGFLTGCSLCQGFLGLSFPPEWQNAESCVFFQSFVLKERHRWWGAPRRWVGSSWSPAAIRALSLARLVQSPGAALGQPRCTPGQSCSCSVHISDLLHGQTCVSSVPGGNGFKY